MTGLAPQAHGLTGWHMYFREIGAVLAVLPLIRGWGELQVGIQYASLGKGFFSIKLSRRAQRAVSAKPGMQRPHRLGVGRGPACAQQFGGPVAGLHIRAGIALVGGGLLIGQAHHIAQIGVLAR